MHSKGIHLNNDFMILNEPSSQNLKTHNRKLTLINGNSLHTYRKTNSSWFIDNLLLSSNKTIELKSNKGSFCSKTKYKTVKVNSKA